MAIFEFSLGAVLDYSQERILSDYNMAEGGFMGLRLLSCCLLQRWQPGHVASANIPLTQTLWRTYYDYMLIRR